MRWFYNFTVFLEFLKFVLFLRQTLKKCCNLKVRPGKPKKLKIFGSKIITKDHNQDFLIE